MAAVHNTLFHKNYLNMLIQGIQLKSRKCCNPGTNAVTGNKAECG
jgi:hypothetical protein